jgi:hypothetical protein
MDVFKKICILYGCDYSNDTFVENNMNIFNAFQLFKKYRDATGDTPDFYEWIVNEEIHSMRYIDEINKNIKLFNIDETKNLELYDHIKIVNGPINKNLLIDIMKKENFIFI